MYFLSYKESIYGWSKTTLILLLALAFSIHAFASSSEEQVVKITASDIFKVVGTVVGVFVVNALIPAGRGWWLRRDEQKNFRNYLDAHAQNAKDSYGKEIDVGVAMNIIGPCDRPAWIEILADNDLGVPQSLLDMHLALDKAIDESRHPEFESKDASCRYFPYLSYFGVAGSPLDASSPLWKAKGRVSERASAYLITEVQINTAVAAQYADDFMELIKKGGHDQMVRWCDSGRGIILDMAEHYIATIRLLNVLNKKNIIFRVYEWFQGLVSSN